MPLTYTERNTLEDALNLSRCGGIHYEGARVIGCKAK
nr:MAG TPA: hypothetical protein [Caudoviricetes sp.]